MRDFDGGGVKNEPHTLNMAVYRQEPIDGHRKQKTTLWFWPCDQLQSVSIKCL